MIRYAIISDIHGNLEALKAVLEDIKEQHIDRLICLGDTISKGSHGHECLDLVRLNADAVVCGNNDIRYTKTLDEITGDPDFDYDYFYWTQKQLTGEDISYLRNLPICCEFRLSGRLVRCFHASPDDIDRSVLNFSDYGHKLALFQPTEFTTNERADFVVYGHTHHIDYEKLFGYTLVNAGSVGNSLNIISDPQINSVKTSEFIMAEYVILTGEDSDKTADIGIEFRSVPYDKAKELEDFTYNPKREIYTGEIIFGEYRNPERITEKLQKLHKDEW